MSSSQNLHSHNERERPDADPLDDLISIGYGLPLSNSRPTSVYEQFTAIAKLEPSRIAVKCDGEATSYGELDKWADNIAANLFASKISTRGRVAVLAEQSTSMIASVLGIMRFGSAYVPINPGLPRKGIIDRLEDAGVGGVVVTRTTVGQLAGLGLPFVRADELNSISKGFISLPLTESHNEAYLIYTSGSSGEPKGVIVSHKQLAASTEARQTAYPEIPTFLLLSALAFDSSVAGIWSALTLGGTLVIATSREIRDPELLINLIETHSVTHFLCIPSLYSVLLDAADRFDEHWNRSLKTVILAGESLNENLVKRHFNQRFNAVPLVNEYGPTETTVWASYHRFESPGPVSIGRPIPGANIYILDEHFRPVRRGVSGEIYIGGAGVSCGYNGRPESTAKVFLQDPFSEDEGAQMYRTGDFACWNESGTIDFLGRRDNQVKIRGHRVELEAMEAALCSVGGVRDAVVVSNRTQTELTGFVLAGNDPGEDILRGEMLKLFPNSIVPARIRKLNRFPLLVNGKIDRRQLEFLAEGECESTSGNIFVQQKIDPPVQGDIFNQVTAAWAEILGLNTIPSGINFFDLGGNSLQMFKLQDALERHTGFRPSVVDLFRHSTVSAQTELICNHQRDSGERSSIAEAAVARHARTFRANPQSPIAGDETTAHSIWLQCPYPNAEARYNLICFPHAGGSASFFRDWGENLPEFEVYAVRYPGRAERIEEAPPSDLLTLAKEIAESMKNLTASRPIVLFGHSMGAAIALETARSLENQGLCVDHLFASGSCNGPCPEFDPIKEETVEDDNDTLMDQLVNLGGTNTELASDPAFQELVLEYIRSDTRMFHDYAMNLAPRLTCPVTTITGDIDFDSDCRPWRDLTTGGFFELLVSGDHFYLIPKPPFALMRAQLDLKITYERECD